MQGLDFWGFPNKTQKGIENQREVRNYRFMTNFSNKQRHIYEATLSVTREDMILKDEAFYGSDHDIPLKDSGALWVNTNISNLSAFWKIFDSIRDYYKE